MIGQLTQCIHVGRPREITKFAVDKLRSATPIRISLSSTVEAVATLVIKHLFRKLFSRNRVKKLPPEVLGLLLRCWWVEMKVKSLSIDRGNISSRNI